MHAIASIVAGSAARSKRQPICCLGFCAQDDCGVVYANAAKDYGAMQDAIAALPDVKMIHSVKAPDLGPTDAPKVCQFRRVAKDVKDDWCDIMRLLDTANDERFLSEVKQGFFSDLVRGQHIQL